MSHILHVEIRPRSGRFHFDLLRQIIDEKMNRFVVGAETRKICVNMKKPAANVLTWIGAATTAALAQLGITVHVTLPIRRRVRARGRNLGSRLDEDSDSDPSSLEQKFTIYFG